MFHTFVPPEAFFAGGEAEFSYRGGGNRWLCVREYRGIRTVERVISTDPFDYLEPDITPGIRLGTDPAGRLFK